MNFHVQIWLKDTAVYCTRVTTQYIRQQKQYDTQSTYKNYQTQ